MCSTRYAVCAPELAVDGGFSIGKAQAAYRATLRLSGRDHDVVPGGLLLEEELDVIVIGRIQYGYVCSTAELHRGSVEFLPVPRGNSYGCSRLDGYDRSCESDTRTSTDNKYALVAERMHDFSDPF